MRAIKKPSARGPIKSYCQPTENFGRAIRFFSTPPFPEPCLLVPATIARPTFCCRLTKENTRFFSWSMRTVSSTRRVIATTTCSGEPSRSNTDPCPTWLRPVSPARHRPVRGKASPSLGQPPILATLPPSVRGSNGFFCPPIPRSEETASLQILNLRTPFLPVERHRDRRRSLSRSLALPPTATFVLLSNPTPIVNSSRSTEPITLP